MPLASLNDIRLEFGKFVLLDELNLDISPGERVALVGANGSGKTTIFKILNKQLDPTAGTVFHSRGLKVGYLPQQARVDMDITVRQAARKAFDEVRDLEKRIETLSHEMASAEGDQLKYLMDDYSRLEAMHQAAGGFSWEHRVEQVLDGVGFSHEDRDKSCNILSGGQHCRLALARVLLSGADLLLLDEPTNHLDLDAVIWLEKFLLHCPASVVLISHDRYMLDRVVTKVFQLRGGKLEMFPGNYSNYVKQNKIRKLELHRQYIKDKEYIEKERYFIARFHAGAARGKEARGRATRLERRLKAGEFVTEDVMADKTLSLKIKASQPNRLPALEMEKVSKAFGDTRIIEDLKLKLDRSDKVAILGPNGIGKTTVMKMALGLETPDSGTVRLGRAATVGYFDQQQQRLDESLTVLEQMREFTGHTTSEQQARSFLGAFLFTGDDVFKNVSTLSGGEKSRLLLAGVLWSGPNLLVLDEPTNHLDIPSRQMLEDALDEYDGAIFMVSHDRYFVDHICNRMLVMSPAGWEMFEGSYTDWQARQDAIEQQSDIDEDTKSQNRTEIRKQRKKRQLSPTQTPATTVGGLNSYQLSRLNADQIEQQIHDLEARRSQLENSFSDPDVFSVPEKLSRAHKEYEAADEQINVLFDIWQFKLEQES